MKLCLLAIFLTLALIGGSDAWWGYGLGYGWGGLGYGWGGYGLGYGYPYYGLGYYGRGLGYYWRRDVGSDELVLSNLTQCAYISEGSIVSCHGPVGVIECEAQLIGEPINYRSFGIGLFEPTVGLATELYRYSLFPRAIDNSGWLGTSFLSGGVEKFWSFFFSDSYLNQNYEGIRIVDSVCFGRLIDLFRGSLGRRLISLPDNSTVNIFGEIDWVASRENVRF